MFVPMDILLRDGSDREWVISGCATLSGLKFPIDAFVLASREKGDWYFSDLDVLVPRDSAWRRCSFLKTRSNSGTPHRLGPHSTLECPTVTVSCPDDISRTTLVYRAHLTDLQVGQKVTYMWSVSRGKIKSGQGTSSITIDRPDDMNGFTATVEVQGLPDGCVNAASCTTVF